MSKDFEEEFREGAEDIKVSKFNPAQLKMFRLHDYNKLINYCKINPKIINLEYAEYNYMIWLRTINVLYGEIRPLMKEKEIKEIESIKDAIETNMLKFPVLRIRKTSTGKTTTDFKDEVWNIYKSWFELYENKVKEYADIHGLDTPQKDEAQYF
jgi:hypothetical protein